MAGAACGARDEGPGPLPWRVSGRVGFTVDAAAFPESTDFALDVYVRITPATLAALVHDTLDVSRIRVTTTLRNAYGGQPQSAAQEFQVAPGDSVGGFGRVVLHRFPARPGIHQLTVKVEDLHSRKRGLAYLGRRVTESGTVEGEIEIPASEAGRDLSNLEFVWSERQAERGGSFLRLGRAVIPNPERLYGLFANDLRLFFVARGGPRDDRPWRWTARVMGADGAVVVERESSEVAAPRLSAGVTLDLSREPAGGYDVEVRVWQEGDPVPLMRRAHFSVAWKAESWLRNPRDIGDDIHFLLSPDAEETFAAMFPGEQERFMDDFWRVRDPTPTTAENEARDAFLRRVEIANGLYGRSGVERGMFSDMGRVFIRYGDPSEVLKQVIPAGDETLSRIVEQISATEDRPVGEVHGRGLGGDLRPFEVWIYEGELPLPPDADPRVTRNVGHRRMLFLFVDEQGLGDYRLRYSTE